MVLAVMLIIVMIILIISGGGKPTLEAPHVLCLGNTNDHSFCWLPFSLNVPGVSNGNVMNYIYVLTPSDRNISQVLFFLRRI
jgi:hypothetical protein